MAENAANLDHAISEQNWIDRAAEPVQRAIAPIINKSPVVASVLHGEWLGHPLHAALTDIPVGAWSTGFVFDLTEKFTGTRRLRRAADAAIVVGLVSAMGAAVAGMADWSKTRGQERRLGFVHASTNMVIAGLYGASIYARRTRKRTLGVALSSVGFGLLLFSAWLGGELSYRHGVGMRKEAFQRNREDVDYLADLEFMRTQP